MTAVDAYLRRLQRLSLEMGRHLMPVTAAERAQRLTDFDAALIERGFTTGMLKVERHNRVRTGDPFQGTAWLIEGSPARLCWDYVPHLAAYVEMIDHLRFPAAAVRFETPEAEHSLDLAALDAEGRVLVLGGVLRGAGSLADMERIIQEFTGDPGMPAPRNEAAAPAGVRRDAWKVAHQIWQTQPTYAWLIAPGARRAFDVGVDGGRITLTQRPFLPIGTKLWPAGFEGETPRITGTV